MTMLSLHTSLCLACSSSLPPRKSTNDTTFHTPCCGRPICSRCLVSNPRLARYDPCLRCLGGVGVVKARSKAQGSRVTSYDCEESRGDISPRNIDGGVHDEDVFVLGHDNDDEEQEDADEEYIPGVTQSADTSLVLPPMLAECEHRASVASPTQTTMDNNEDEEKAETKDTNVSSHSDPLKYYIRPGDTLLGISFKLGIDRRLLCRLNNLPPSTLHTTPHILHTRTYLTLPPSTKVPPLSENDAIVDEQRRAQREREVAEKRFQALTKEKTSTMG
ncbi:unnamed protein product [Somion occarium]|uniref:LysM domain-containing protein n=1 Tax=Somion occarium TaxID=3059160 RepID=A0ABP1E8V8_9APHY